MHRLEKKRSKKLKIDNKILRKRDRETEKVTIFKNVVSMYKNEKKKEIEKIENP